MLANSSLIFRNTQERILDTIGENIRLLNEPDIDVFFFFFASTRAFIFNKHPRLNRSIRDTFVEAMVIRKSE